MPLHGSPLAPRTHARARARTHTPPLCSPRLQFNELMWRKKKLIFGKSAIHSWGLYAAEPIDKGDFVVEYLGEYVRKEVAQEREKYYRRAGFGDDYIFRVRRHFMPTAGSFACRRWALLRRVTTARAPS